MGALLSEPITLESDDSDRADTPTSSSQSSSAFDEHVDLPGPEWDVDSTESDTEPPWLIEDAGTESSDSNSMDWIDWVLETPSPVEDPIVWVVSPPSPVRPSTPPLAGEPTVESPMSYDTSAQSSHHDGSESASSEQGDDQGEDEPGCLRAICRRWLCCGS